MSQGDPARFSSSDALAKGLASMPAAPADGGRVVMVVVRTDGGRRVTPRRALLTEDDGVEGDAWARDPGRVLDGQITAMQAGVATLLANGQPLALFGDNLFLDLDLSRENLPAGSRVRIGGALLEVTPKPHTGCRKFSGRFGADALRFISRPDLRARHLRGIYLKVLEAGAVAVGDRVDVISR